MNLDLNLTEVSQENLPQGNDKSDDRIMTETEENKAMQRESA